MASADVPADSSFEVGLAGPIDLPASLLPLGRWGDDGIDRWDGRRLLRTAFVGGSHQPTAYAAIAIGSVARPRLVVTVASAAPGAELAGAVAETFAVTAGAREALAELAEEDAPIGAIAARYAGLVPVLYRDPLAALVRSISAQQVNLRWAAEIRRRLAVTFGRRHEVAGEQVHSLEPEPLAHAPVEQLRALQLTTAKSVSVIACARAAVEGRLRLTDLEALDDDALIAQLTALPGIGRWSAEWFLARTLGRPRVVAGDLGVRKAIGRLYLEGRLPTEEEVRRLTGHWGAAASLAQALALHDLAAAPVSSLARPRRAPAPRRG